MNTKALESLLLKVTSSVRKRWENHPNPQWKNTLNSDFAKEVSKELDEIKNFLSTEADLAAYDNALLNIKPAGSKQVHHWALAQNLLFISLTENPRHAVQSLDKFLKLDHVPVEGVYALSGVKLPREVELTSDLKLVPFNYIPESSHKSNFIGPVSQIIRYMCGLPPYLQPTAAFVKNYRANPKVLDAPKGTRSLSTDYKDPEISDACLWLSLIGDTRPMVVVSWFNVADWVPFSRHSIGGGITYHHPDISSKTLIHHVAEFTETDIAKVQELHRKFEALKDTDKSKLRVPLARLNQALRRPQQVDQAIDLGTALEALLISEGTREQLSLTFRLRGAWLLGDTPYRRVKLYDEFESIYTLRSKAVHSGVLKPIEKQKKKDIVVGELLDRGFDYCRRAIYKIICEGKFPKWESLVLGGNLQDVFNRKIRYRVCIRKKSQGEKTIPKTSVPIWLKKRGTTKYQDLHRK